MKAVILHGTGSTHKNNWFPWMKKELEKLGYEVWVPDLPQAEKPNIARYNKFLLGSAWDFQDNLIIGHSSGAVAALGLLQNLPQKLVIDTVILAGVYQGDLGREDLKETNIAFDYQKIKKKARHFIVVHSDDDPICPLEGTKEIASALDAKMIVMSGMKHFSVHTNPRFSKFPELLEIIKEKIPSK